MTEENNNSEVVETTNNVADTKTINFLDTLNEDLRNEPALKDFKDVNGLAKSYISANKMIGRSDIPTEKSSIEDWNKFYKKLGRPENGYSLNENQEETEQIKALKENCFNSGLTQKQFDNVLKTLQDIEIKEENEQQEKAKNFVEEFNRTFGDKVDEVRENAKALINKYSTPEDVEILNTMDEKQVLAFTRLLNSIGNVNVKEGQLVSGNPQGKTLSQINERMRELKKNNTFYSDLKEYQDLEKQKMELYSKGERL